MLLARVRHFALPFIIIINYSKASAQRLGVNQQYYYQLFQGISLAFGCEPAFMSSVSSPFLTFLIIFVSFCNKMREKGEKNGKKTYFDWQTGYPPPICWWKKQLSTFQPHVNLVTGKAAKSSLAKSISPILLQELSDGWNFQMPLFSSA